MPRADFLVFPPVSYLARLRAILSSLAGARLDATHAVEHATGRTLESTSNCYFFILFLLFPIPSAELFMFGPVIPLTSFSAVELFATGTLILVVVRVAAPCFTGSTADPFRGDFLDIGPC